MPLDTHQVFKHLKRDNVFTEEQADRLAEALSEMDVASATKEDLDATEKRLADRIDEVENRLDSQIDEVANRLDNRVDEVANRIDNRTDEVADRLDNRVDEVADRLDDRIDEVENRLNQRIELSEERLGQRISDLRSDLYRVLLIGFGAVAALVTVLNYVIGG